MTPEIRTLADAEAIAHVAAGEFCRRCAAAVAEGGRFTAVLSGGSTPRLLFRELACEPARSLPWETIHIFWGDERTVPPDHPDSNFRTAWDELLSHVAVPAANIHRLHGEDLDPAAAAAGYEADLRAFFDLGPGQLPRFDLVFLGMGGDGHTASLFPGSGALIEPTHLAVAPWVDSLSVRRLTLTSRVFNAAACVVFLVAGGDKAAALRRVLEGPRHPLDLPSQGIVPPDGDLVWLVDQAAARLLSPRAVPAR